MSELIPKFAHRWRARTARRTWCRSTLRSERTAPGRVWFEFHPTGEGKQLLRTGQETTQSNRMRSSIGRWGWNRYTWMEPLPGHKAAWRSCVTLTDLVEQISEFVFLDERSTSRTSSTVHDSEMWLSAEKMLRVSKCAR